ncbi:MAG: lipoate--protein ligase family protein [Candidatus Odinarchaeia archaeon]
MDRWRFIDIEANNAFRNMAIDNAILETLSQNSSVPTLRFYRWKPSAVSIGYFQSIYDEVDVDACAELGVDVVRRITGGGAVFHDFNGELTYSILIPESDRRVPKDILKSYEILCKGIVIALNNLGLDAEFRPVNDIIVGGKKISGNAQTRRQGVVLQHGTILVDFEPEIMFRVLKVSKTKILDKMIKSVKHRVTSIKDELGRKIKFEELRDKLLSGFSEALNVEFDYGHLTENEASLAEKLEREKYSTKEWNYKR